MDFAEKLKLLRIQNRLSQEALAKACGVSRQAVSKWELSLSVPQMDRLLHLSRLFRVSADYLMNPDFESPEKPCGS